MFRGHLRPGQGFQTFTVFERKSGKTEKGRPKTKALKEEGELKGIISQASPEEKEQWKQRGHPITHTIVQRGGKDRAEANDVLELKGTDRKFYVQTAHDPGELGHFIVYKVEEREDL